MLCRDKIFSGLKTSYLFILHTCTSVLPVEWTQLIWHFTSKHLCFFVADLSHVFFYDRPCTCFWWQTSCFFTADLSRVFFCDRPFTCFFTADLSRVFFCDRPFTWFFYSRPFTCVFLWQTFHMFFYSRPFTLLFLWQTFHMFFGTDLSHYFFWQTFHIFWWDRLFTFSFCNRPLICWFFRHTFHMCLWQTFLSFLLRQTFHIYFFFCDRPFTCFFCCCCRPTSSLSNRVSSKGFKAPLARQGPGKLHIPGPFVVSFIIIRCHVIDGLGIVGSWPCYVERQALF